MYNPLYYLMDYYNRTDSSLIPAKLFRINTGVFQSDISVNTEINLVLALFNYKKQSIDVNLEMFWEKKHIMAERKKDADINFIEWEKSKLIL